MLPETLKGCTVLLVLMFSYASGEIGTSPTGLTGAFCVANENAAPQALQTGLTWACGLGSANCSAIQPGQPCYVADNLPALASYAYNDYYHRALAIGGTCSFSNTATITDKDPSHDSCVFAGSLGSGAGAGAGSGINPNQNSSIIGRPDLNLGPSENSVSAQQVLQFTYLICSASLLLLTC